MKKILLFSTPFTGQLNTIKEIIKNYNNKFEFQLIITGWKDISPNLGDIANFDILIHDLQRSNLTDLSPGVFTFPRVNDLLDDCIKIAESFKPDLIVYNYFSLEGHFTGKLLSIPSYSIISAMIGPNDSSSYVKKSLANKKTKNAIKSIQDKYNLKMDLKNIEIASDGLHIPGSKNLLCSYPTLTPQNFLLNRQKHPYFFVGNPSLNKKQSESKTNNRPLIYFSFGTVVMNKPYKKNVKNMKSFIKVITKLSNGLNFDFVFSEGKEPVLNKYPKNWKALSYVKQKDVLSRTNVFITHGGANSFHEAVLSKVPMVVVPFFGDQIIVSKQVDKLGLGVGLNKSVSVDADKKKNFLTTSLAKKIINSVIYIVENQESYQKKFNKLELKVSNLESVLIGNK